MYDEGEGDYIAARARMEAEFIRDTGATVRQAARRFMVSKSTVHTAVK